jgi:phytoene dehydrogenase-like protein
MEVIVIGSGIGGILGALTMKSLGYDVFIFERGARIGGCATIFVKEGFRYNAGATTLPGLKPGFPMHRLLTLFGMEDKIKNTLIPEDLIVEVSFTPERSFCIFSDSERTCEEVARLFPGKGHKKFFAFIERTTKDILTTPVEYPLNGGRFSPWMVLKAMSKLQGLKLLPYLALMKKGALSLLSSFYDSVPSELLSYFRAQTMIVGQVELEKANALAFALSLGYFFTGISHCLRGVGGFLEGLAREVPVRLNSQVERVEKKDRGYVVHLKDGELYAQNVLVSIPILENLSIFSSNQDIVKHFSRFTSKLSPYSAFVVYGRMKRKALENFKAKHALIITDEHQNGWTSGYLYVSLLEQENPDFVTFTISTHTPLKLWNALNKDKIKEMKTLLESRIVDTLIKRYSLDPKDIVEFFSATPYTFKRYVNRFSLGGFTASTDNPIWSIPNNFTPFKGLYLTCDHAFAGQGFMGIALGCLNLYQGLKG